MGKKGKWLSAIKKVFAPNSKEKGVEAEIDKETKTKKKWGLGKLRHGDTNSFIPLQRKPSSIEKILGEAEREKQKVQLRAPTLDQQMTLPLSPMSYDHMNQNNNTNTSTTATATTTTRTNNYRALASANHNIAAIKIQSIYRGYMARRSFRALKGLVRLQGVVKGQSVKRQTMNAMKYMQLLVKVQTQIQSRRIQTLENNQALQNHNLQNNDKDLENNLARWLLTQSSEKGHQGQWDDSMLTKEELDARLQRKVEAIIKRERALAYVHSNQLTKATSKSAQTAFMELRSGGFPWWWNWIERQLPENHSEIRARQAKNELTPRRLTQIPEKRPESSNSKLIPSLDSLTPRSLKTPVAALACKSTPISHSKPRSNNGAEFPLRDDDSLTSCPPFSVPNYMTPTVSAKAKARSHSNPKDRLPATPTREQKRRLSFPLAQSIGSLRFNKGSLFLSKDSNSQNVLGKNKPLHSIGNVSVDSTVSLPAGLGRKPFK